MIIAFISVLIIILVFIGIQFTYETNLIDYFKTHDIEFENFSKMSQENIVAEFDMYLLNLNWLTSYRGQFYSFLFNPKFQCKIYSKYIVLGVKVIGNETYSIKIPKRSCALKKDIFAGNLLKIQFDKFSLTFKLPNQQQNIIYKMF